MIGLALRTYARAWRAALIALTLPALPGLVSASCEVHALGETPAMTPRAELHLAWARAHLAEDWDGYGALDDMMVDAFDAVILSHLAVGILNVATMEPARRDELRPMIDEVVRRAVSAEVSPLGVPAERARELGDENLYASHLLLVLGVAHRMGATEPHDALAERLARHLRERSLRSADGHARSFPGSARWPADQAVTLAALDLHDREHGTSHARRPIERWLAWMRRHEVRGLPWSATGGLDYARVPRGCALSWTSFFAAQFAPDEGARWYEAYRAQHAISTWGWRGFREWLVGEDRGSDVDAGPVLFGYGTAATGIGLGPARLYGDEAQYAGIERLADTVGMRVPGSARYLLSPTLGQAILFAGETATFWHERPARMVRTEREHPIGPILALAMLAVVDAWLLRGIWRVGTR